MSSPRIELRGVSFTYPGVTAGVFDIDLAIRAGELMAVIGASGCGKSTLLRLIAGFLTPERGTIRIAGREVTHTPPRARALGVVFQTYALFPHMTALENTAYPLKVRGVRPAERRARARETLETVGLGDLVHRLPHDLSGGQQQRVALARALVFRPRALLLDEPLSALDAALRVEMRDEIRRIQRAYDIATLHITHDQQEALSMADRVAVMRSGRIEQVASPRELYEHPMNRDVAAFVGHANLWPGAISGSDSVETPLGRIATERHGLAIGHKVMVMVRPEKIRLGAAPPGGSNTFAGEVRLDRFLGPVRQFDLAVRGGTITGETDEAIPITCVHIPRSSVYLLPAEGEGQTRLMEKVS
ncbi:MAG: ABC transporter ATP-binding protein [Geminicoccaceae bacterium]